MAQLLSRNTQMDFLHASVALLASMVLVLAGMVGWLYWQQTRIQHNMNSILDVLGELGKLVVEAARPPPAPEPETTQEVDIPTTASADEEDDRVSVTPEETPAVDIVEGPPNTEPLDTDGLESKTKKELQDLLTKRGIPFGKGDSKTILVSLLKATA